MKTIKEKVAQVAAGLGCRSQDLETVWNALEGKAFPLTARSMVLQVATAMESVGLTPDRDRIEAIAGRL